MATSAVVCPECGAPLERGRFSCRACGFLLVSAAGRSVEPMTEEAPRDEPGTVSDEPEPLAPGAPASMSLPAVQPAMPAPVAPSAPAAQQAPVVPTPAAPAPAAPTAAPTRRSRAPLLTDQLVETPYDVAGWLVRGGALAAALSFVLPWARSSAGIVGTGAIGYGYFDRWSLANAWYLLPLLLGLFVFGLAVVPNRLVLWLRIGVLPLVAAALYLGIVFVYLGGPFGGGPGVTVLGLAALILGAGGLLAIRPDRHDEPGSTV